MPSTNGAFAALSLRRLAAAGAAIATVLAVAACGSTDNGTSSSSSSGATATVTAVNFAFQPATVAISGGSVTVTFQNNGTTTHSLTLDNGGGEAVADAGKSATLSFTAPQSGTVAFHCKFHSSMHGSFTVGGGGAGAGGGASSSSSSSSSGYGY